MIPLIGITGRAQHGKSTVARLLHEELPGYKVFAFSDALKSFGKAGFAARIPEEQCKEGQQTFVTSKAQLIHAAIGFLHPARELYLSKLGITKEHIDIDWLVWLIKEQHPDYSGLPGGQIIFTSSWRHMWQLIGTDWARGMIHEDFWVTPFIPIDGYHIVSDVRGHGDCPTQEEWNNEAIAVIRLGGLVVRVVDPRKGEVVRPHASEAGIEDKYIAHTIVNDGDLEDLRRKVRNFIDVWIERDGL
ncbi:deoxynucleoside-5-monophosphate kinase [Aeromonas phage vB_AsaP_MQM1]|nr:deoxynucleoside-5-monophosphate kinase [Aeromonas phage vB_AsaP_MQM1]